MTTAEMRVPHGRGLGIPDARGLRLRVEGDMLVLHQPRADPRVVSTVASLSGMVWLDPDETLRMLGTRRRRWAARVLAPLGTGLMRRRLNSAGAGDLADVLPADAVAAGGAVVLLEPTRPVLAVELASFVSGGHDGPSVRELSGANRLARGLGLVIERGDASALDATSLRDVHLEPWRPDPRWVALTQLLCLAAAVVGFAGWPFPDTLTVGIHASLALVAALLLVLPVGAMVRGRRAYLDLVTHPPAAGERDEVPLPAASDGTARLQLGPLDVVLVDPAGVEFWLQGPDAGGVRRCEVAQDVTVWMDGSGLVLGPTLLTSEVAPDAASRERLRATCDRAGIAFSDTSPLPGLHGAGLPYALAYDDNWQHPNSEHGWETGVLSLLTEYLSLVALLVLVPAVVGAVVDVPAIGWPALVVWLACALARTWVGAVFRRRRRALIRAPRLLREGLSR